LKINYQGHVGNKRGKEIPKQMYKLRPINFWRLFLPLLPGDARGASMLAQVEIAAGSVLLLTQCENSIGSGESYGWQRAEGGWTDRSP